ncbi:hypothetical protein DFH27DRAFT_191014 [Peziza echinospora]|nr:hypothetical protein DFH27DRAFT_191014 [Peziza echinospora]
MRRRESLLSPRVQVSPSIPFSLSLSFLLSVIANFLLLVSCQSHLSSGFPLWVVPPHSGMALLAHFPPLVQLLRSQPPVLILIPSFPPNPLNRPSSRVTVFRYSTFCTGGIPNSWPTSNRSSRLPFQRPRLSVGESERANVRLFSFA